MMKMTAILAVFLLACSAVVAVAVAAVPVTDGLIIHLDAGTLTGLSNGDPVTTWSDAATGDGVDGSVGEDAGYGTPTYVTNAINGLPALRFVRAEEDVLESGLWAYPDPSAGVTIFVVCQGGDSGSVERVFQVGAASGLGGHLVGVDVSQATSGCRYNNGNSLSLSGSNPITPGVYAVAVRQLAQEGRYDSLLYAVGDLEAEGLNCTNPGNTITFDASDNHISVGTGASPGGAWYPDFYNGDLAELLVYNAQLSALQMQQVGVYLRDKYALGFGAAAIVVSESDGSTTVAEGGAGDEIEISLANDPGAYPVTIQVEDVLDPDQVVVSMSEVEFTTGNWQTPATVEITAIDDGDLERAVHDTQLRLTVVTDPGSAYYGISLNDMWVNVEENECGAWGNAPADYNLDCVVDLKDFALFALDWVECSEPDPQCQGD